MRILADMHISPRTVEWLRSQGHDAVRVSDLLAPTASDESIVAIADRDGWVILTQDLDFSALVALRGVDRPSVISLRLASPRVEQVNSSIAQVIQAAEQALDDGAIVTVDRSRIRVRMLPLVRGGESE